MGGRGRKGGTKWWGDAKRIAIHYTDAMSRYLSLSERNAYRCLEDVVGCKWSAAVVAAIARGVTRPGQLERYIPGISAKILHERLRKLLAHELVTRQETPGPVLRVEYALTPTGRKLARIIAQLQQLDATHVVVRGRKHAP